MAPRIEAYRFGSITVDGEQHSRDLIILPDRVIAGWWRQEGHALHPEDLTPVIEVAPETLVVGTGAHGLMQVTGETRRVLEEAGIRLVVSPTDEAVRTYNDLREQARIAAALHLTC